MGIWVERRKEAVQMNRLYLTFEGQHVGESGLPVDAFAHALTGMQDAM